MVLGSGLSRFFRGGRRKLTIMVVPHSQKQVVNFQTTVFSMVFFLVILGGIIASFFWFSQQSLTTGQDLAKLRNEARTARASLDQLKDETGNLVKAARNFQAAFSGTLSLIGIDTDNAR